MLVPVKVEGVTIAAINLDEVSIIGIEEMSKRNAHDKEERFVLVVYHKHSVEPMFQYEHTDREVLQTTMDEMINHTFPQTMWTP